MIKHFELSFDDGTIEDLRLADFLERRGLKATFYIPCNRTGLTYDQLREIARFHEVGAHTMTHPSDLKLLDDVDLKWEIFTSKENLEDILGKMVEKFCYPRGRFDQRVKDVVKAAGFTQARTARVGAFQLPTDPFEWDTSLHVLTNRKEYNGQPVTWYARDLLKKAAFQPDGYFHLWGHSEEVNRLGLWRKLEQLIDLIEEYL